MTQHAWLDRWSLRHVMRGGGSNDGGQTYQNTSQNSTSTTGANPAISPYLEGMAKTAYDRYTRQGTPAYPDVTLATPSAGTQSALQTQWEAAASQGKMLGDTYQGLAPTISGQYLDIASNPYWQEGLAASLRPQTEQMRDITMPSIDARFAGAGRYGSGAHALTTTQALKDLSQAQADASAKTAAEVYQSERDKQLQAIGMMPALTAADQSRVAQMRGVGSAYDQQAQALINDANARTSYGYTAPLQWDLYNAMALQSMVPGGQTTGSSSGYSSGYTPGSGGGGLAQSLIGGGASLIGAALPLFSDRRDKTDIEELGVDPLTGMPMYAYRYKGDPKSYPKVVGPMAQDIEAAGGPVREIGGHKVVAMPPGGLM